MKLDRGTINVFLMSIAFLMSVTCFTTVLNFAKVVQDALKDDYPNFRAHPYYTYILYEAFLCLGVLLAPVWLRCVTPKYTIVLTEFVTMFYPLQYLFPDTYLMYVASSVSGPSPAGPSNPKTKNARYRFPQRPRQRLDRHDARAELLEGGHGKERRSPLAHR